MKKHRILRRARTTLASALATFVAIQLALYAVLSGSGAALRDAEFGGKLDRLRARLEEAPQTPLLLLLGSSRSANGVSPCRMVSATTPDGQKPLVFNFAMTGHGPVQELILLRRLLRRGIRPDYVLVEIHPCLLYQELGGYSEETWIQVDRLERGDLSTLRRYVARPSRWTWNWWRPWFVPAHSQRLSILNRWTPCWLEAGARQSLFDQIDTLGWLSPPFARPTADDRRRWTENARRSYLPAFQRFRVTALADRAIRELLDVCRDEGIVTGLFLMPEGGDFRGWYPPAAHGEVG
ncbi:MAG TPA: hypothetical protein VMV69_12195, partial [Pirellulales bacterium]|nr:hypothetical protein [Pirellulales bacterium]